MPEPVKLVENLTGHWTKAQISAKRSAQIDIVRRKVNLKVPQSIKDNESAVKYWRDTMKRMRGISLLDDLDTDILAAYCRMSADRDDMTAAYKSALCMDDGSDPVMRMSIMSSASDLYKTIQSQDRLILNYASKIGLTPESRVRLAKRKAEERPVEKDEMFGD